MRIDHAHRAVYQYFFYFAVKKSGKQYLQNDQSHQILVKKLSEFCFSMVLKEVSILTRNLLG